MEYTDTKMELSIMENGVVINNTAKVEKSGLMVRHTMETMQMDKKMGKVTLNGKMELLMKEILLRIILKVMEHISGQMGEHTPVSGKIIRCMVQAYFSG